MNTEATNAMEIAMPYAGARYTNVPIVPSTVVALLGGAITVMLAHFVKEPFPAFHALIMDRGPVQFVTIYAFWFTFGLLGFKFSRLLRERSAFELPFIQSFTAGRDVVGFKTILVDASRIEEDLDPREKDLLLVNRINKGIKQVEIGNSPADVANVLSSVAETDSAIIDSSYVSVRFMIWAIPVLGFIGTITGMTQAIGSFDAVLGGIDEVGFAGIQDRLGLVTGGLAVAFETTFLALILALVLNLLSNAVQKKEEDLLSDVEEFTTRNIVNKLTELKARIPAPGSPAVPEDLGQAIEEMTRELRNMNRQNQVNSDELLSRINSLVSALESTGSKVMDDHLGALGGDSSQRHAELLGELGNIAHLLERQVAALSNPPASGAGRTP